MFAADSLLYRPNAYRGIHAKTLQSSRGKLLFRRMPDEPPSIATGLELTMSGPQGLTKSKPGGGRPDSRHCPCIVVLGAGHTISHAAVKPNQRVPSTEVLVMSEDL